ncbi:MAG: BTAD domain-containing putative transcriptional regulator [Gemmatimonadales bacterium]|nr:BTAD domain-containing putative transcriptional regulator [Gemmatimonadales bacterium]
MLTMLGRIRLEGDDGIELDALARMPKRLALLAYLASPRPGTWHRRDRLTAVFWPELDTNRARTTLRNAIYVLRQHLTPATIRTRGDDEVALDPAMITTDAAALESDLEAGRPADALARYQGELLPGFHIPGAEGFEKWLDDERNRIRSLALKAADRLMTEAEASSNWTAAAAAGNRALEIEPNDETMVRRVIGLFDRGGDRAQALAVYERFRARLAAEFDAEPAPDTTTLAEEIRNRRTEGRTSERIATYPVGRPDPHAAPQTAVAPHSATSRRPFSRLAGAVLTAIAVGAAIFFLRPKPSAQGSTPIQLVVLPIQNDAGAGYDYLAAGLADEIARRLRHVGPQLTVKSAARAEWPGGTREDHQKIRKALGVQTAVEARLAAPGDSLEVRAELVDLETGRRQPIEVVRFGITTIADAGSKLAASIAGGVFRRPIPLGPASPAPSVDAESYRLTLEGWHHQTRREFARAKELFARATELDPGNAAAWSGLGSAWGALAVSYAVPWADGWLKSRTASLRALELDSLQGSALANIGVFRALESRSVAAGESLVTRAIQIDPGDAGPFLAQQALYRHAWAWDKARDGIRLARQIDPLNPYFVDREALVEMCAGRPAEALALYREVLAMDSTRRDGFWGTARALATLGRWDEALDELRRYAERTRDSLVTRDLVGARGETGYWRVLEADGQRRLARLIERGRREWISRAQLGMFQVGAGWLEEGLATLEAEVATDEVGLYRLPCFAEVDRVRDNPRFQALLHRLKPTSP